MDHLLYYGDSVSPQSPADVGVVMPTTLSSGRIVEAVRSVYAQRFTGRIQLAIGVDVAEGEDWRELSAALDARPANLSALVLRLPYSTSVRHGGVHTPHDGGALRAILSLIANSRRLTYLDDDNTWTPDHLSALDAAMQERLWAYSQRMLVDEDTGEELGVDLWDSAGPGHGTFAPYGFVDTNCLMLDKARVAGALGAWAHTLDGLPGFTSDQRFFRMIAKLPHGKVDAATVRYRIRKGNRLRIALIEANGQRAVAVPSTPG